MRDNIGVNCELCHRKFLDPAEKLYYYIDQDPDNQDPANIICLCYPCMKHFRQANPTVLQEKFGIFAFAINRRLYDFQKANNPGGKNNVAISV